MIELGLEAKFRTKGTEETFFAEDFLFAQHFSMVAFMR